MRNAFAEALTELGQKNEKVVLMMGDIGNRLFDQYKLACPDRFYNCGIAEANMVSMAAGLAIQGFRPVCYTIAPFLIYRAMEQIRLDVCYHHQPVILVGTGAGLNYGNLGATHHSLEDIGMLRALPEMTIVCPCDPIEVKLALVEALQCDRPLYMRIGKKGEKNIRQEDWGFEIGKSIVVRDGVDVCIVSTGTMLQQAILAAEDLKKYEEISCQVVHMHTVKPIDSDRLQDMVKNYKLIISLEEHSLIGGLGGAIAEWMIDHHTQASETQLIRLGTADQFLHEVGSAEWLRKEQGLTSSKIVQAIERSFGHASRHRF